MPPQILTRIAAALLALAVSGPLSVRAAEGDEAARVKEAVDAAVKPLLAQHGIPGLAVGVTIDGRRHFVEYGLAAKNPAVPVTRETLFELGSISKTFTATLAALAAVEGELSLEGPIATSLPELKGTPLGAVPVLHLATHTAGGFPLQLPEEVTTEAKLTAYFRAWKPKAEPGRIRTYANPSVGLLGMVAARAMGQSFGSLSAGLYRDLDMSRTFIEVPAAEQAAYAWGYRQGKPVRASAGPTAAEAWGVKSNTADMLRWLEVNMGVGAAPERIARAAMATHTGYFRAGPFVQDLIWEQYPWPVAVEDLVAGSASRMATTAVPAAAIEPPMAPRADVLINKTGSTGGFGAYVAFLPEKRIGIVMLANTFYPNEARVRAAHAVLSRLLD